MSPTITVILIIIVLVVAAAVVYGLQAGRRKKLRSTFGPEYDRVVADTGNRTEAEKELRERERRHSKLELKELSPESQARYAQAWADVQILFIDDPAKAADTADDLVTRLIAERGYPTGEYDERLADLSVEHANTLQHYRDAHDISERSRAGSASTEDLRKALVHYRALFADLLGTDPVPESTNGTGTTAPAGNNSVKTVPNPSATNPAMTSSTETGPATTNPAETAPTDTNQSEPARSRTARSETAPAEQNPAPAPRRAADDVAPDTRR
jgi:hypothetical protein